MPALTVFNHVSLDGFFAGPRGEIDWFKTIRPDDEYFAYTHRQAEAGGTLVFGRVTYQMMKSWWPTEAARASDPLMARVVNANPKLVFSKTLPEQEDEPNWKNVTVVREIDPDELARRKTSSKTGLTILGSGSIVRELTKRRLIDEYRLVVVPVVLGAGKSMFEGIGETPLSLADAKTFGNGIALLTYRPV